MSTSLQPAAMPSSVRCSLLILCASLAGASLAEIVFRCPGCTAERQALCPTPTETCAEIVREPGCGCCPVCARQEGETCGVYTPRCATGLRCYPTPDSELPLEQLVQGEGQCRRKVDPETSTHSQEHREPTSGEAVEPLPEQGVSEVPAVRKPTKEATWLGPKESAVRQHRQEMKTKMKTNKVEEVKPARPKQTQCQQELDQVLERISKMPFRDNRGPLEDLYALHIPNCDKRGQYNLKQCKMSLHGQRGECWCVNPHTGRPIPSSPTVRGDPNCSQYLRELELELPDTAQM
ncbi:insulin-like growth factor-binding protein 2-A [Hippoglossus hippoglossus]|uniref:insulin-like growth factor-binding protein 2-A n=1 Tax=Hippoglossus hippoglossus TaxID=8267 RepID=UPI00148B70E4|nr:insulin-like growth factor-binding protein 2-A [Hippoglossus hippoglossus]XP_035005637.1 insulin-like growth factor-binding protein 2-A [Hippoglossus stenolepis]